MENRQPELDLQINIAAGDWPEESALKELVAETLNHAAGYLAEKACQLFSDGPLEVSLVFADDAFIRRINAEWRSQDKPTNVLSFPAFPIRPGDKPGPMLGDIILAHETLVREAAELDKPFAAHLKHLLVHGFLHLFGHDHMNDDEANLMEGLETRILAGLGVSDPYGQDDPD